ncbi:MAG TPA: LacI family DNA-binding transcriptional regulator [Phycisphaerales bacterium]|nr:LacI family DNA-binding transcriptional regulator [Phycisphaerales bacterium]
MASVRKIAAKAGVSVATVSRALNNHASVGAETRERVLAVASSVGYSPPASRKQITAVGLVYPGEPVRPDYGAFESALLTGILKGLNDHRYDLKIVAMQRDKLRNESYSQFFARKGIRGVILRSFADTRAVCEAIAAEGFPAIVVADRFENAAVNYVCTDSKDDSRRALQHLINLGHRRIALAIHRVADTDHDDRRRAYFETLESNGVAVEPELVLEINATTEGGAAAITELASLSEPPTAIFFTDPLASIGAMRRCQELGIRIPIDLSIIGFDDSDIRHHVFPSMTAVCQDASMLGYEASRWLTSLLTGNTSASMRKVYPTMFEINKTTAQPSVSPVRVLPDGTRVAVVTTGAAAPKPSGDAPRRPGP